MSSKSPDAFRTISEVADWLQTPAHVLRFWESKFSQVKPVKRAGGRRYYRPADMVLIGGIKKLLHDDGMTIKGVQKVLREQGIKHVSALSPPLDEDLEAMIAPRSAAPAPARPPAPETGRVLEFSARPEPKPAATADLFGADEKPGKAEAAETQVEAAAPPAPPPEVTPDAVAASAEPPQAPEKEPEVAPTTQAEDLPDFVQKPMSERLAEDNAESPADPPPPVAEDPAETPAVNKSPVEEALVAPETSEDMVAAEEPSAAVAPDADLAAVADSPEEEAPEDDTPVAAAPEEDTPVAVTPEEAAVTPVDTPPVADTPAPEAPTADAAPEDAPPLATPVETAADSPAPDADDPPDNDARPEAAQVPPDPRDHEIEAFPGVLTLLTSQEMRGIRHSAERIETLIIRVRNHHRAMNHASRR